MKRFYEKKCVDMGYQAKVFSQKVPSLGNRISGVSGIVILTGTVSHPMTKEAIQASKMYGIPLVRSHSSSVSALKRCLDSFS